MDTNINSHSPSIPGFGTFWIANSITSCLLGASNREIQAKAAERNSEFQLELEKVRNIAQDNLEAEKIAFKRRQMAISRQYRIEEAGLAFDQQLSAIELQSFIERYWPLAPQLPNIILAESKKIRTKQVQPQLHIVVLHQHLLPEVQSSFGLIANPKDRDIYSRIESEIEMYDLPLIKNVKLYRDSFNPQRDLKQGNANLMNIHFLMGQLPSLVISPSYYKGILIFNAAIWDATTPRPFVRALFDIAFEPLIANEDKNYLDEKVDLIRNALSIIIGTTRDSYMTLVNSGSPSFSQLLNDSEHKEMKRLVDTERSIGEYIKNLKQEYSKALDVERNPKIKDAYDDKDIENMRRVLNY